MADNPRELQSWKDDWDQLLADSRNNALPLTHAWVLAWWNSFGRSDSQLHVVGVYRSDGRILAIAPFMKTRACFRRMQVTKMSLMANGYSPFSGIIVRNGANTPQIVDRILGYVVGLDGIDVIELTKIDETGDLCAAAVRYLRTSGQPFGLAANVESPFIPITTDWDTFLGGLSKNFERQIHKKLNRLQRSNDTAVRRVVVEDQSNPAIGGILAVSNASWKQELAAHIEGNPHGKRFLLELCDRFGPTKAVSIWELVKGGVPVAFEYHITYDGVVYVLRADFRDELRDLSPGSTLECYILRTLFDESTVREYNTCGGAYHYLLRWTKMTRRLVDVQIFPRRPFPLFLFALEYRLIPVVRRLRQVRNSGLRKLRGVVRGPVAKRHWDW